jgi:hypothetical protein
MAKVTNVKMTKKMNVKNILELLLNSKNSSKHIVLNQGMFDWKMNVEMAVDFFKGISPSKQYEVKNSEEHMLIIENQNKPI